jgi:hypothetical protein
VGQGPRQDHQDAREPGTAVRSLRAQRTPWESNVHAQLQPLRRHDGCGAKPEYRDARVR